MDEFNEIISENGDPEKLENFLFHLINHQADITGNRVTLYTAAGDRDISLAYLWRELEGKEDA